LLQGVARVAQQISIPAADTNLHSSSRYRVDNSKSNKLWSMLTMVDRFLDSFLVGKSGSQKETLAKPEEMH
jgi:hypothetical protein